MEKKSNFVQVPLWLLSELSGKEIKLFCRMYNGWCLMQDADGWYYRAISKLKEDADIKSKCNNEVINAVLHFEELGIVIVERNGKKTNKFKFNEHLMFNHEEYDTNDNDSEEGCMQNTYKGCMQNTYKQVEGDVCKMHTIYNTKENIKNNTPCTSTRDLKVKNEIFHVNTPCIVHGLEDKNESKLDDMKYNDELITQDERDAWDVLSVHDEFDYTQYSDIAEMVKRDTGSRVKYDERNEWISRLFGELDCLLNLLSQCYEKDRVAGKDGYGDKLNRLFSAGDSKVDEGWFTEKQLYKYQRYINKYNGLMKDRRKRFKMGEYSVKCVENEGTPSNKDISEKFHVVMNDGNSSIEGESNKNSIISTGLSVSVDAPAPPAAIQKEKKFGDFDSVEEWLAHIDAKFSLTTEDPMVAYGNNSVKEAEKQFANIMQKYA